MFPARASRACSSNTPRSGYSPGHTHPKLAFIYGTVPGEAIRGQVNDGPVTTYKAGQSFSELPDDRHGVSAYASETKPAKLLAVFVVDTNETELTIPFRELRFNTVCPEILRREKIRGANARVRVLNPDVAVECPAEFGSNSRALQWAAQVASSDAPGSQATVSRLAACGLDRL